MSASKNFTWEELECKCGCGTRCINKYAINALQQLRDRLGRPLVISSAARCPAHNTAVGGATNSRHISIMGPDVGCLKVSDAFDIVLTPVINPSELIAVAKKVGFNGIGIAKTFIHADTRDIPASWTY